LPTVNGVKVKISDKVDGANRQPADAKNCHHAHKHTISTLCSSEFYVLTVGHLRR